MKCVCIQYLIALQRLRLQQGEEGADWRPLRTVRLAWVPDEEIGGADGMGVLLGSCWFKQVTIGIALDEVSLSICIS
jgi:aminoacylase